MNMDIILEGLFLASLFLSTIYVVGVVWRVEGELDISYKFLSISVIALLFSEILSISSPVFPDRVMMLSNILRTLFGCTLLVSIFLMRDVVRKEDGELEKPETRG